MSHAEAYKLCGMGKNSKCYPISHTKGKRNCAEMGTSKSMCEFALKNRLKRY